MRTSLLLICLYTVNSFIARPYLYKNNYITLSRRADDYLEDENINDNVNKDKPKPIVYRYRGIPPKLCASEEEEKMLEKMIRASNYSDIALGNAFGNAFDDALDENTDEDVLYSALKKNYDNLTIDDKINIALAQEFLENGDFF
jgi:hypothetical protein